MRLTTASKKPFLFLPKFVQAAVLLAAAAGLFGLAPAIRADTSSNSDIQQKINDTNAQIAALEKEIAQYQNSLATVSAQKKTLQSELNRLDLSRKKIATDISLTQEKITQANLELSQLRGAITDKQARIAKDKDSAAASLRNIAKTEERTLVEGLLTSDGLVSAWEEVSANSTLNSALGRDIGDLQTTEEALSADYDQTQANEAKLVSLEQSLGGQKSVLDQNRKEEATLLTQTKNKESNYQNLIAQKKAEEAAFEQQLNDYQATLKYTLDPTQIPKAGSGVLSFPLDLGYMARCQNQKSIYGNIYCITQYFGNTAFAQSGAYNGKGHNGVDFGAPEGTKVVAALSGTVLGTGNTDLEAGCYSYGKWVYVQHDNGLGSIYGHLSVISVSKGERVETGQLLGYSGKTGYATGPHLHFGLYVASQVKIIKLGDVKATTGCGNTYMPVAPTEAYLNPMAYL
ncbi:MAG: peptidoglycan DD-metalloendopeptidase family protein [Patescibacteria group bacterium]|nr:peptidoglycan DD-metalloendopeptidase family protein [Patescibacteria group bacterium]